MKIAIAGGSGMIGSAIRHAAERAGHEVVVLHVPRPEKSRADNPHAWERALASWTPQFMSSYDVIMFFGGEPINSRWTDHKLRRIELSRQMPCRKIAESCAAAEHPPKLIVTASATGYYGSRGEALLTEEAAAGSGILASTTAAWEASWEYARDANIPVVMLRLGVVLSTTGGALRLMLPAFKAALGGRMGSGDQWMSWITLDDAARLAIWCMDTDAVSGPVNAVSPEPVRQYEFARALGDALSRPAVVPAPEMALKLAFGRMAEETILSSCRVVPAKASEGGFHFNDIEIATALRRLLRQTHKTAPSHIK